MMGGFAGGGMWMWSVGGTLIVVLLGLMILKMSKK